MPCSMWSIASICLAARTPVRVCADEATWLLAICPRVVRRVVAAMVVRLPAVCLPAGQAWASDLMANNQNGLQLTSCRVAAHLGWWMRDDRLQPVEMADEHLDAYGYQDEAAQELGLDAPRDGRTETDAEQIADDREKR